MIILKLTVGSQTKFVEGKGIKDCIAAARADCVPEHIIYAGEAFAKGGISPADWLRAKARLKAGAEAK